MGSNSSISIWGTTIPTAVVDFTDLWTISHSPVYFEDQCIIQNSVTVSGGCIINADLNQLEFDSRLFFVYHVLLNILIIKGSNLMISLVLPALLIELIHLPSQFTFPILLYHQVYFQGL
jgi:hypothetical protein